VSTLSSSTSASLSASSVSSPSIRAKRDISWSPHNENELIVGGPDLRFYSLTYKHASTLLRRPRASGSTSTNTTSSSSSSSSSSTVSLVASQLDGAAAGVGDQKWLTLHLINSELPLFRCLAWSPASYAPQCLAVGQSNGRVALATRSPVHSVFVQFVPRHLRPCNAVAWNHSLTGYLAAGLDRVRGDYSALVWDVAHSSSAAPPAASTTASAAAAAASAAAAAAADDGDVDYLDDPVAAEKLLRTRSESSKRQLAFDGDDVPTPATAATMSSVDNVFDVKPHEADSTVSKPLYELCNSEAVLALEWLPDSPSSLAMGTGAKFLRIADLRASAQAAQSVAAHSRGVYGVTFDPFHARRLATFSDDGIVKLWDMRRLVEPTHTLAVGAKALLSIKWCPTRSGILATLARDENCVKLFDLKARFELPRSQLSDANAGLFTTPSGSTRLLPRTVTAKRDGMSSFSWHPTSEDLLITVSEEAVVELVALTKPVSLGLSPTGQLAFVHERQVVIAPTSAASVDAYVPPSPQPMPWIDDGVMRSGGGALNADIALVMRARARLKYGMDVAHNSELVRPWKEHPKLRALWDWMHACVRADEAAEQARLEQESDDEASEGDTAAPTVSAELRAKRRFMGVLSLLYDTDAVSDKAAPLAPDDYTTAPIFTVRLSPQRQRCLDHIGWYASNRLDDTLRRAEEAGEFERAAALAVFFMDLKRAIQILYRAQTVRSRSVDDATSNAIAAAAGATTAAAATTTTTTTAAAAAAAAAVGGGGDDVLPDSDAPGVDLATGDVNLKLVAMALAGYEGGALWRQTCRSLMNQLKHPYLQACFAFLCAERREKNFKAVLITDISLRDKLGFAMRYLDDVELHRFIDRRTTAAVRMGDLEGILLTGLANNRAVDLLQSYVNRTADVQTACLAMSHVVPLVFEDERVRRWVESYRDLLDRWGMWRARAEFDTQRVPFANQKQPPQIYVRCGSCGQSLTVGSTSGKNASRLRSQAARRPDQQRLNNCPFCAKPLPRCAVCLLSLSGALPGTQQRSQAHALRGGWQTAAVPFDDWFTWCQKCKHGGHASHILAWHKEHERCPVTGCDCKCGLVK
jgi:WD repeat-containing protein mio